MYTMPSCIMDIILIDIYNLLFVATHVVYDAIFHDFNRTSTKS